MDEAEVEVVAEELAKLGGTTWYPGREQGPVLRVVHERYRDRARAAIAALDRYRAEKTGEPTPSAPEKRSFDQKVDSPALLTPSDNIEVGATVIYRPPGDRRAYPCTVEKITDGHIYLTPQDRSGISWVFTAPGAPETEKETGH
ncbi:hypothetical protein [Microvirga terricola]|nr:hypothetical protein [Microvirga terricola]